MADETEVKAVTLDAVQALLGENGYEVTSEGDSVLRVRELDSGIVIHCVLEDNILFHTVTCVAVPKSALTAEVMGKMLASDNGISTSSFQLYDRADGKVAITLNNFCKLLAMGTDDADDILSCLEFLEVDVVAARGLIGGLVE